MLSIFQQKSQIFVITEQLKTTLNIKHQFVILISKFIERHLKAKQRAPAYLRALQRIRGIVHKSSSG